MRNRPPLRKSTVYPVMIRNRILSSFFLILSLSGICETGGDSVLDRFNKEENPEKALSVITEYAESTSEPVKKYEAYVRAAHLLNLTGNYDRAQFFYEQAFAAQPDHPDFKMLLYSAALLIELNQWDRAQNQIDICLIRCNDENLLISAYFYSTYLAFLKGDGNACAAGVRKILDIGVRDNRFDLNYFLPWINFFSEIHSKEFRNITAFLKTAGYPIDTADFDFRLLSPAMILSEQIGSGNSLPDTEKTDPVPVPAQTQKLIVAGSYLKRENADAVLKDLEMQGFSGKIKKTERDGKEFYRIYVLPIENDYKNTLSVLKQMDIDAFIVNDIY